MPKFRRTLAKRWLSRLLLVLLWVPAIACKKKKSAAKVAQTLRKDLARVPFRMAVQEVGKQQGANAFIQVILLTASVSNLDYYFVTAKAAPGQGAVQGKLVKKSNYALDLEGTCLRMLTLEKSSDEASFGKGDPLVFKIRYAPGKTAVGTEVAITITVVQKDAKGTVVHQEQQAKTICVRAPAKKKPASKNGKTK
ncbi:MAG: hypothetical protein AAFQ08_00465 [Bacteroidota bacterium]